MPVRSTTVQILSPTTSSDEENHLSVDPVQMGTEMGHVGWGTRKGKVDDRGCCSRYEALPAVIHLINLDLAMDAVWMPSKLVCNLSCICLATGTLTFQGGQSDCVRSDVCPQQIGPGHLPAILQ